MTLVLQVPRGPPVQLDHKAPPVHKGQRETPALPVQQVLPERLEFQERLALLAQRGLPAQLDPKALSAQLDPKAPSAHRDQQGTPVQPDRPGRKALRGLPDRVEGLTVGRSFKATALSSCRLESAG